MPPKPRGRGASRARGSARGGAVSGRATTGASESTDATPQSTAAADASEAAAEPVVPKQEDGDAKPVVSGDGASEAIESQASEAPSATASYALSPHLLDGSTDIRTTGLSHHPNLAQNQPPALQCKDSAVSRAQCLLRDLHHRLYAAAAAQLEGRGASKPPPLPGEGAKRSETLSQKNWLPAIEKGQRSRLQRKLGSRRTQQGQQDEKPAS